jgi:hypothetical protein
MILAVVLKLRVIQPFRKLHLLLIGEFGGSRGRRQAKSYNHSQSTQNARKKQKARQSTNEG